MSTMYKRAVSKFDAAKEKFLKLYLSKNLKKATAPPIKPKILSKAYPRPGELLYTLPNHAIMCHGGIVLVLQLEYIADDYAYVTMLCSCGNVRSATCPRIILEAPLRIA